MERCHDNKLPKQTTKTNKETHYARKHTHTHTLLTFNKQLKITPVLPLVATNTIPFFHGTLAHILVPFSFRPKTPSSKIDGAHPSICLSMSVYLCLPSSSQKNNTNNSRIALELDLGLLRTARGGRGRRRRLQEGERDV